MRRVPANHPYREHLVSSNRRIVYSRARERERERERGGGWKTKRGTESIDHANHLHADELTVGQQSLQPIGISYAKDQLGGTGIVR